MLDLLEPGGGLLARFDDLFDGRSILALERLQQVDAFFEFGELCRVEVELFRVVDQSARQVFQLHHHRGVRRGHRRGGGVDLFEFAQQAGGLGEPMHDGRLAFGEFLRDTRGEFDEPPAVRRQRVAGLEPGLLVGPQLGGLNLRNLVPQKLQFAVQRSLVGREVAMLQPQRPQPVPDFLVLQPRRLGPAESVEQIELPLGAQERLVVVRPMQIDQKVAQLLEHGERRRRAVDELPVAARLGEGALDDERAVDAAFQAVSVEFRVELVAILHVERAFDRAGVRAGANLPFVGAFAQQELERADDDRFARPGFTRDGDEAGREVPVEFFDERQVFDAQRGERCEHGARV